jgi:proteasome accessory factor B
MAGRVMNRTERLEDIEQLLLRHVNGLRAVELAEACGVDRRTIYRDLSMMGDIGVPVYQKEGRFFLDREHYAAQVRLNLNEAVALLLAARVFSRSDMPQNPNIASAFAKLGRVLPESMAAHFGYVVETFRRNAVDRSFMSVLEAVTTAWAKQVRVKLWCIHHGQRADIREFAPYFIEPGRMGTLYVIGLDHSNQRVGALNLSQIYRAQVLNVPYKISASLDRHTLIDNTIIHHASGEARKTEVVLAFQADVLPAIRQQMGRLGERIKVLDDQRALVKLRVQDWQDILPWVRSWGPNVEVLKPDGLREALASDAARMIAYYQARS